MQRRALLSLVIFLSFWKIPLHAANKPDRSVQDLTGVERRLDSIEAKLTNADVSSRLEKIDEDLTEMKHSSLLMTMLPSVLAAIAALAGIGVGALAQGRLQQAPSSCCRRLTGVLLHIIQPVKK